MEKTKMYFLLDFYKLPIWFTSRGGSTLGAVGHLMVQCAYHFPLVQFHQAFVHVYQMIECGLNNKTYR